MKLNFADLLTAGSAGAMVFPCPGCGTAAVSRGNVFCSECLTALCGFHGPYCPGCGGDLDTALAVCSRCLHADRHSWDGAVALFPHRGLGRRLIHQFKYRQTPELARAFGLLAAEVLRERGIAPGMIVPVPLHWTRQWWRGFNQTELIGRVLAAETGIPLRPLLRRVRRTRRQASLNREQRRKNLDAAFSISDVKFYCNDSILLVDDVMTTGSTLEAATAVLRRAGAEKVFVMVLARR